MKVEEREDDIIVQEREFRPSGDLSEEEHMAEDDADDEQDADSRKPKMNMQLLVPLGVVGCIIVILLLVVGLKMLKKAPDEEDYSYLDDMLSSEPAFEYTLEEIQELRNAGYTGFEIEDYEFAEIDAASLIEAAEEERRAKIEAEMVPYMEAASDEFKTLLDKTWLGMDQFEIPDDAESWTYTTGKFNVDYEKIGTRGLQCFIKIQMEDGAVGFITILPDRYAAIADSGNMVVELRQCVMSNGIKVIIGADEVVVQ